MLRGAFKWNPCCSYSDILRYFGLTNGRQCLLFLIICRLMESVRVSALEAWSATQCQKAHKFCKQSSTSTVVAVRQLKVCFDVAY